MEKVALYCRLSVEDGTGEESESIRNQRLLLLEYAARAGWQVYAVYEDEDYSGLREDRPAFCRMLADAEKRAFSLILCKTQSRFTRNATTAEWYLHRQFPQWGIRFVTVVDGVDTAKRENKKTRQINSLVNEWYSEELSENIRAVLRRKMELGQFLGNYAPYGYEKDPKNRHRLLILEEEAGVVRTMAKWYLSGLSYGKIAERLNVAEIPSPAMAKQARGQDLGRQSRGAWTRGTVRKIIQNPVYLGHMVQGKEAKASFKDTKTIARPKEAWVVVEDTHEAIFSKRTAAALQKKQKENPKK